MQIEELAKKAYYAYQKISEDPTTTWEDLNPEDKEKWFKVVAVIVPEKIPVMSPTRCFWEVTAGVIPGHPLPQYSRRFGVTSHEHETSNGDITVMKMVEALEYARSLHTPESLNWVNFTWIWV
jgi:hypothetical protein